MEYTLLKWFGELFFRIINIQLTLMAPTESYWKTQAHKHKGARDGFNGEQKPLLVDTCIQTAHQTGSMKHIST